MSDGPFIEEIAPLDQLRAEYVNNDNKHFAKQIDHLWRQDYQIRRTKGHLRYIDEILRLKFVQAMVAAFIDVSLQIHWNGVYYIFEQLWHSLMLSDCWFTLSVCAMP